MPPLTSRLVSRAPVRRIRMGHRGTRGELDVKGELIACESALERDFLLLLDIEPGAREVYGVDGRVQG